MSQDAWLAVAVWLGTQGLQIVLIILGSIILARLAGAISRRITRRITKGEESRDTLVRSEAAKHGYALAQVITYVVVALIGVVAAVGVTERLGIALTTLVAPATVLGAALGFGAQRIVQDFLAGFFVVSERHYGYGDVVELWITGASEPAKGTVEDVTLRTTRLRSADGEVITVPNGLITKNINYSKDWARAVVDVPVRNDEMMIAHKQLDDLCKETFEDQDVRPFLLDTPTTVGPQQLGTEESVLRIVARTLPGSQFHVSRILRARVATVMTSFGIDPGTVTSVTAEEEVHRA